MKSRIGLVIIIVAAFFLMGMGKMDSSEKPGEIPVPDKEVTAVITDSEGLTLNLTQFSINGKTYLTGQVRGRPRGRSFQPNPGYDPFFRAQGNSRQGGVDRSTAR